RRSARCRRGAAWSAPSAISMPPAPGSTNRRPAGDGGNAARLTAPGRSGPAGLVVDGPGLVDQRLPRRPVAAALGPGQHLGADVLPAAGVVALVELVAAGELGADGVP